MTNQDVNYILNELKKLNFKPDEWEKSFLGNIVNHRKISDKQSDILIRIYSKATGGGLYQKRQYFSGKI